MNLIIEHQKKIVAQGSKVNQTYLDVFSASPVYKNDGWYFEDASGEGNDVLVKNQQVATFENGNEYITTGKTIPGQTPLTVRFVIKFTNVASNRIMRTTLATNQKGINIETVSNGALKVDVRDGGGTTKTHTFPVILENNTLYDISIAWNGLTGGSITANINGVEYVVDATGSWTSESVNGAMVGQSTSSIRGYLAYFKTNELFELVFNHGSGNRMINTLNTPEMFIIYNTGVNFWNNGVDGVEPFQLTRGGTIYQNRRTYELLIVSGNVVDETITVSSVIYNRLNYYQNGITKGKNTYVLPSVMDVGGEYDFEGLRQLSGKYIKKEESYFSIKSLKVDNGISEFEKTLQISGGNEILNKYFILNFHKGNSLYDVHKNDIFFNGRCKDDFSDVRIYDENDNIISFDIISKGNYDIIPNTLTGLCVSLTGRIFRTNSYVFITYSDNDGKDWTELTFKGTYLFVTELNTLIFTDTTEYKIYRSEPPYASRTAVLDFSADGGRFLDTGIAQFDTGEIIAGKYQNDFGAKLYKSTDDGQTWSEVYSNVSLQHIHKLYIDYSQEPSVIYAGVDGTPYPVLKSIDKGENWTDFQPERSSDYGVIYADVGYRLIGGETHIKNGYSIQKTTNDSVFSPKLSLTNAVGWVRKINGKLFAGFSSGYISENTGILVSKDEGETWQIAYMTKPFNGGGVTDGFTFATNPIQPLTAPKESIIVRGEELFPLNIVSGSSDYSALALCKIQVPIAGTTIKVVSKRSGNIPELDTLIDKSFAETLLKIPFNEGTGTSINEEISENSLTVTNPAWVDGIKRLYNFYPPIQDTKELNAIKFNVDSTISPVSLNLTGGNFTLLFWSKMAEITADEVLLSFGNTESHGLTVKNSYILYQGASQIVNLWQGNTGKYPKFYAFTVDASGNVQLYVNGGGEISVFAGTNPIDLTLFTGDCYFFVNHFAIAGLSNFSHPVQELQLVNRILIATEISDMYGGLIDDLYE